MRKKIIIFHQCSCSLLTCFGWVYPFQYSGLENSMTLQGVGHNWATFITFTWVSLGMFGVFFFFFCLFALVYLVHEAVIGVQKCQFFCFSLFQERKHLSTIENFLCWLSSYFPFFPNLIFFLNSWFKKLYFSKSKKKFGWTCRLTIRRSTSKGKGPMLTNSFKYMHVDITLSLAE